MLDADELYIVADRMVDILDELNRWAIIDIAERIIEMQNLHLDSLPGTVIWLREVTEQCGMHYSTMLRKVSQITDIASDELDRLFKDAAVDIYNNDVELYQDHDIDITKITDYESLSEANKQIVEEMYNRTDKSMRNFTRTTANASQQLLMQQLDKAYTEVRFGYKSYDKAIADAIKEVSKETLTVTYASGYKDSIETNIRRAVLTAVNQTAGQMGVNNAIESGCEYVIVSSHLGARMSDDPVANHYGWQGQIYKINGSDDKYKNLYEATGFDYTRKNSNPLGLFGYNCRHSIFPHWLGDSNPFKKYGKEENKEAYEKNKRKREFERKKRRLKTAVKAYDKAIENCKDIKTKMELQERKDIAKEMLRQHNKEYKNFISNEFAIDKKDGIIKNIVDTHGKRNEEPLTEKQKEECIEYATKLGFSQENIHICGPDETSPTGVLFGVQLYINNDILPAPDGTTPNSLVSLKGALAHEIIGHYETIKKNTAFQSIYYNEHGIPTSIPKNEAKDEAQASIRAARFAPDLSNEERYILIRDALTRLKHENIKLNDIRNELDIESR